MNERSIANLIAETVADVSSETVGLPSAAELGSRIAHRLVNRDKAEKLTSALALFPVLVLFDPRSVLVQVPDAYRGKPTLALRVGYNLQPPIADLVIDTTGFDGSFSFNRVPYRCVVPWEAVFALHNERREMIAMWPSSIPEEILTPAAGPEKKRHLSLV